MCDYGSGISAEPISGGTGRLGRALTLGPRSLLSVPRPLPSQKFKGMVSGSVHQHALQPGLGCDMHAGAEVSKRWDIVMMAQV